MPFHTIYITKDCLLKCAYCFEVGKYSNSLNAKQAFSILEKIYQLDHNPTLIEILGGEPLLNWDIFLKIIHYCKNKNTPLSTITNGILLDQEKIKILKKHHVLLGISYDGKTTHDVYRRTKNNLGTEKIVREKILELISCGLDVNICMTFQKANANHIEKDIEELFQYGIKRFLIYTVYNNYFAVRKSIRYKIYKNLESFAKKHNITIKLSMDYTEKKEDSYYYSQRCPVK